jgi:hypothetical protein
VNFFEKRKLKSMLMVCNYSLAGEIIHSKFSSKTGQNAITELIQEYLANPGFEMAVKLIEYEPQLMIYFVECNPEGFYSRQLQKRMIDTQEHQAFLDLLGNETTEATRSVAATSEQEDDSSTSLNTVAQQDKPQGRTYPNVIQTLQDNIRELQLQVWECEKDIAELEKRGSPQVDLKRRWLMICKAGIKEFEDAIRALQ